MFIMTDPPGPFASLKDWQEFLAEMKRQPQTPEVKEASKRAREVIAEKESEQ